MAYAAFGGAPWGTPITSPLYGGLGTPGGSAPDPITYPTDESFGADYDCAVVVAYPGGSLGFDDAEILNIRLNESAPATWSLSTTDETGQYVPTRRWLDAAGTVPNPWYGVMTEQAFSYTDAISYSRTMTASVTHNGETLEFVGVPTARAHTARWPDGKVRTTWSGTDQSHVLFRDNQSMAPVRGPSNGGSTTYSTSAMAAVAGNYGLGLDAGNVPSNIPVPKQQRVREKPIKWITDLLSVPVGEWQCDPAGGTIRVYVPDDGTPPAISGTFDLSNDWIEEVNDDASEVGFAFNRVVSTRALEVAAVIAGTPVPVTDFKQYTATFPQAIANVKWNVVNAFNGVFSDFIGYLGSTAVATARRRIIGGATMNGQAVDVIDNSSTGSWGLVDSVKFTWGPPVTYTTTQSDTVTRGAAAYGLIQFNGSDPALAGFGPQTIWEYSDPPAPTNTGPGISITGPVSGGQYVVRLNGVVVGSLDTYIDAHNLASSLIGDHPKILEGNPYIPNDTWLTLNARRWRRRLTRDAIRTKLKMPLRLGVKVGQWWLYVNRKTGVSTVMYVPSVEHNISRNWQQRYTVVSLVGYPIW